MRKKIIVTILGIVLYAIPIYAGQEVKVKAGYVRFSCPNIEDSAVLGLSYEAKTRWVGIEAELQGFMPDIPQVNRLHASSISLIPKLYIANWYNGFKAGYIFNYADGMDADDEIVRGLVSGFDLGRYFIEFQYNIADFDLETGLPETPIEGHSRLNNWQVLVGKRIKF